SFHDPLQYRETLINGQGMGGLYALFIGAVTALLLVLFLGITLLRFQATMLPQVMDRLPEIEISQGQVSIHNGPEGPLQLEHDGGLIVIDIDSSEEEFLKTPDLLLGDGRDVIINK